MRVNGYEIGEEPTKEEFATFFMVEEFFEKEAIAERLDGIGLTQDEFELLHHRFHKLDFSDTQVDSLDYEIERILDERSL